MNWYDLVRKYFPKANDDLCEIILWEKTIYPMGSVAQVENQIREYKKTHRQYV